MTEYLAFENDSLWDAALATALWIWWMKPAVVVDCVPLILWECTILTFLVASVGLRTLLSLGCNITIEGLVLTTVDHALVLVKAVGALLVGAMTTASFGRKAGTFHFRAVGALCGGGMVAPWDFLLFFFNLLGLSTIITCCYWCRILCILSRCINQIADSADNGTRWLLAFWQIRHICVLVPYMQDVAIAEFQRLNWCRVTASQRLLQRIVSEKLDLLCRDGETLR